MPRALLVDVAAATPRTRRLRLELAQPFGFRAGQAVIAGLSGRGPRVPYSIASPPSLGKAGAIELLVASDNVFGTADGPALVGATVDIEGPIGQFGVPDAAGTAPLVLVAGGTGIAPLRSVILDRAGRATPPPVLVYSVRTAAEVAFADDFAELAARGHLVFHTAVTRDVHDTWPAGRLDAARLGAALPGRDAWCLVCGPEAFVASVTASLVTLGVAPDHIVVER